ncbi:MAG: hypothetical protein ACKO8Z_10170 [Prosthecobacter sp.]
MKKILFILISAMAALAALNPSEEDYREHVRKKKGVSGSAALALMDLLSFDKKGSIRRQNFLIASRFYLDGDGLLPRENRAWGIAGLFIDSN